MPFSPQAREQDRRNRVAGLILSGAKFWSVPEIAAELGLSVKQVQAAVDFLSPRGIISRQPPCDAPSYTYAAPLRIDPPGFPGPHRGPVRPAVNTD